jgi:hypothetical protein
MSEGLTGKGLVKYGQHPKVLPYVTCEACGGSTPDPVADHCHAHGWVRGTLCRSCNTQMRFIDRLVVPYVGKARLGSLLAFHLRCSECLPLTAADLRRESAQFPFSAEEAARQLAEGIEAASLGRMERFLGLHEVFASLRERLPRAAREIVAQMSSDDDRVAEQSSAKVFAILFNRSKRIPDDFWATPLGRLMAKSAGHPSLDEVPYSVAAAMLGVSKTRIQQLVEAGKLERHPGGGITSASVRLRAQGTA